MVELDSCWAAMVAGSWPRRRRLSFLYHSLTLTDRSEPLLSAESQWLRFLCVRPFSVNYRRRYRKRENRQGCLRYYRWYQNNENSVKCIEIILFLLIILMRIYWRRRPAAMKIYFSEISSQKL